MNKRPIQEQNNFFVENKDVLLSIVHIDNAIFKTPISSVIRKCLRWRLHRGASKKVKMMLAKFRAFETYIAIHASASRIIANVLPRPLDAVRDLPIWKMSQFTNHFTMGHWMSETNQFHVWISLSCSG